MLANIKIVLRILTKTVSLKMSINALEASYYYYTGCHFQGVRSDFLAKVIHINENGLTLPLGATANQIRFEI